MSFDIDVTRRIGDAHIRLAFRSGEGLTALFGASGSGKTSVLNMIAGLLRPDAGHVIVAGETLFGEGVDLPPDRRHAGFLRDTPAVALAEYPRYLKGLALRAERALRDPARDQQRMLDLKPFADALEGATASGVGADPDWQALRWDLEELRVSLFAQELGAKGGVSPKKLAARLAALRDG